MIDNGIKCVGCGVCSLVCPKSCIQMKLNDEGFLYPEVTLDSCIQCGRCDSVCIQKQEMHKRHVKDCYWLLYDNNEVWNKSTSGGAFAAICEACQKDTYICGAVYSGTHVLHTIIPPNSNLYSQMQKSKYIQSEIADVFCVIKEILDNGDKVLFSGTPCQIAALKLYLRKDYINLLCVDLVCHGVGSPGVFEKYIESIEKKQGKKIDSVQFRVKRTEKGKLFEYGFLYTCSDGSKHLSFDDLFTKAFLQGIVHRPSCLNCQFCGPQRIGDITIGDLKYMFENFPQFKKDLRNRSAVYVNSEKGESIMKKVMLDCNVLIDKADFDLIAYKNAPVLNTRGQQDSVMRDQFFEEYIKNPDKVEEILQKNCSKQTLMIKLYRQLPDSFRAKINIIRRKMGWRR